MRYLSVCSGIEAATQAWHPLGWQPVAFSEIEPFPCAVLAHHYPHVPNWGDMTKFQEWPDADVDVLCGGTPCQSFSVAGLRKGLADPRGNLMLTFGAIAARYRPRWLVWENVPGVLSSNGGRDFGTFLGMLGQLGYGVAYRVLDAQYVRTRRFPVAVPQRRRRVFVVGYLGDWRRAAAVLFDRESLSGHPAPRREAGKGTAASVAPSLTGSGRGVERAGETRGQDPVVAVSNSGEVGYCLTASAQQSLDAETETLLAVAHALRGEGFDASEDGTGRGTPLVPVAYRTAGDGAVYEEGDATAPLTTGTDSSASIVAFDMRGREGGAQLEGPHDTANIRAASGGSSRSYVAASWMVRRLTPRECERLQGFPDDHTLVPVKTKRKIDADELRRLRSLSHDQLADLFGVDPESFTGCSDDDLRRLAADGPRYKALGNSWAVNCAEWIGERIAIVDTWEIPA